MSSQKPSSRPRAYTEAGVDIEAGNAVVGRIKKLVSNTHTHNVLSDIGGFGGLFKPDLEGLENPVLVATTDGVGTKLKLAVAYDHHSTIGIDLVAMSVNDILVQGAKPLFFLDYFATGKLDVDKAATIVAGVVDGCQQAGVPLLGGETAEMPDIYQTGDYDLAGFCVGLVSNNKIVDGSTIKVGDSIIGLASSGPHSNGYSLIRKIIDKSGLKGTDTLPGTDQTLKDIFLAPTIIYAEYIKSLMRDLPINGMAHITGGGFYENIPRSLPSQLKAVIDFGSWDISPVFYWLLEEGKLSWPEMLQIFNCGIGYVMIVKSDLTDEIISRLNAMQMSAWRIGTVEKCTDKDEERVQIVF